MHQTKKPKIIRNKSFVTCDINLYSSCNTTISVAITYNKSLSSILIAFNVSVDFCCVIYKYNMKTKQHQCLCDIEIGNGYITCIKFIHNSDIVIWSSRDCNVYIYNYIKNETVLILKQSVVGVMCTDYYFDNDKTLIIAFCSRSYFIYIVTININMSNNQKMEVIHCQKIQISQDKQDINCIAFSPNNGAMIACGGDDAICRILKKYYINNNNKNVVEYKMIFSEALQGPFEYTQITTCCWINSNIVIFGGIVPILNVINIYEIRNNKQYIDIIMKYVNNIRFITQTILDFCGYHFDEYTMKTTFNDHAKITKIVSLPNYNTAKGIFCVTSLDSTSCLYIPLK